MEMTDSEALSRKRTSERNGDKEVLGLKHVGVVGARARCCLHGADVNGSPSGCVTTRACATGE